MGETLLVLTLVTLIVLTIRRAKPVILDNPVIIQRPGQYHITLAPQLNRAQTFLEQIAKQFIQLHPPEGDLPTQYFEVRDPKVFSQGESCYLLAIALRGGMLYFQAINPQPLIHDADSHYKTLHEFSEEIVTAIIKKRSQDLNTLKSSLGRKLFYLLEEKLKIEAVIFNDLLDRSQGRKKIISHYRT